MSTLEMIRFACAAICEALGLFMVISSVVGNYKFKTVLNRMHAGALADTMGLFFCLLGMVILAGFGAFALKAILMMLFFWIASPVASHLLVKMEVETNAEGTNDLAPIHDLHETKGGNKK